MAAGAAVKTGPDEPVDVASTRARDRLVAQMGLLRSLTSRLAYARSEGEIAHAVVSELRHQNRFAVKREGRVLHRVGGRDGDGAAPRRGRARRGSIPCR